MRVRPACARLTHVNGRLLWTLCPPQSSPAQGSFPAEQRAAGWNKVSSRPPWVLFLLGVQVRWMSVEDTEQHASHFLHVQAAWDVTTLAVSGSFFGKT